MTQTRLRNYARLSLVSAGSAMLAAWILLFAYFWHFERQETLDNLTVQTRLIAANVTAALVFEDARTATEILATLEGAPELREAALYAAKGDALARYLRPGAHQVLGTTAPPHGHVFSLDELQVSLPIRLEQQVVGTITARISLRGFYELALWFASGMLVITLIAIATAHRAGRRLRERMEATEREFERQALTDPITGLANRQAFEQALDLTLRRHLRDGGSSALLFIDLDGFKQVNDTHGHRAGDALLAAIAGHLRDTLRGADIIARIGGDEFGVILTGTASPDDTARVAENLIREGTRPIEVQGATVRVGFSIGIAMLPVDGADVDAALRHADAAMYRAKKIGKGRYQFFSPTVDATPDRRLGIQNDLRAALRGGELYVVYQPQRFVRSGRPAGLEALVRWRHAERGIISPSDFIPIAEEAGLIGDVGRAVLEQVCCDIVELRSAGRVVPPVAVNLSPRQLEPGLATEISTLLGRYGLKPNAIELELPAGPMLANLDAHAPVLAELTAAGLRLSLDDFAGDADAVALVARHPFARIKIDMGLVRELPDNAEVQARVCAVVDAGHGAGLRIVAEGIESAIQADALANTGCDLLQGYHLGLPVRKQELLFFLEQD